MINVVLICINMALLCILVKHALAGRHTVAAHDLRRKLAQAGTGFAQCRCKSREGHRRPLLQSHTPCASSADAALCRPRRSATSANRLRLSVMSA